MRKPHVVGNWKMQGSPRQLETFVSLTHISQYHALFDQVQCVLCPPAIFLSQLNKYKSEGYLVKMGAQDVSAYPDGAYTGQISATMLAQQACEYVIVGHSERRQYGHESNEDVAHKFFAAKEAKLIPILCVGETQSERESGQTEKRILEQLHAVLAQDKKAFERALLAYEPIWAIGTGLTATPTQAQEVHHLLRETLAEYDSAIAKTLPILYGGSVKPSNASTLFSMPDIDGALVGGASLQAEDYLAICQAAGEKYQHV